jgi:hypothetical protein
MPAQLTENVILAAIEGFESQKARIDQQIAELRAMLPGKTTRLAAASETAPRRPKFSPEALQRMREAQQRRWAKVRGEEAAPSAPAEPPKRKRKLSAAGRKAISEASKRRWAAVKKAQSPVAKKSAGRKAAGKKAAKTAPAAAPSTQAGE